MSGEFDLIDKIRRSLPGTPDNLVVGPGDDCAAVRFAPGRLVLLTCDCLVEDRHFSRKMLGPFDLGRRLAAVNISDIAAMGGKPLYALCSLAVPKDDSELWVPELARGVAEELSRFGAHLIGGNLSGIEKKVMADLTVVGEVEEDRILLRSTARPGDAVMVTGYLGSSTIGRLLLDSKVDWEAGFNPLARSHFLPQPRIVEGRVIAKSGLATSMIDLSDGLASDIGHICQESGVGAEIATESLPLLDAMRRAAVLLDLSPDGVALSGGEDYELLFTCPEAHARDLAESVISETGTAATRVGTITKSGGLRFMDDRGREIDLGTTGWDHFESGGQRK